MNIGDKFGCLTLLDLGESYKRNDEYHSIECDRSQEMTPLHNIHYKCKCKCGKIQYYTEETLKSNPRYCYYPIYISSKHTYSTKSSNATYKKKQKYDHLENVMLCYEKEDCAPSEIYCNMYNKYKTKQLDKNRQRISEIPREYALNYALDFSGMQYESLKIVECVDNIESEPKSYYTYGHKKHYHPIIVYKVYRCKCILCGKEQNITCDKFKISKSSMYSSYSSAVYCDCHKISSFQWKVCKLLFESGIRYTVEYAFGDLYGIGRRNLLRFDFAVFDEHEMLKVLIECQGEQHYRSIADFGGEYAYFQQIKNDKLKRNYCKNHNIELIEISYKDSKIEKIIEILNNNGIFINTNQLLLQ